MEFWQQLIGLLGQAFAPEIVSRAIQRGFLAAGLVLAWFALINVIDRRPGSMLGYWLAARRRIHDAMILADKVGALEGKSEGLKTRLTLLLRELEIKAGRVPLSQASQASVLPPPALPVSNLPPLPGLPPIAASLPPPSALPPLSLPPLPPLPSVTP